MHLFTLVRRTVEAVATAIGVVLGLTPDPTRVPIEFDRRRFRQPTPS